MVLQDKNSGPSLKYFTPFARDNHPLSPTYNGQLHATCKSKQLSFTKEIMIVTMQQNIKAIE